jgi:hypothetical protein
MNASKRFAADEPGSLSCEVNIELLDGATDSLRASQMWLRTDFDCCPSLGLHPERRTHPSIWEDASRG